MLLIFIIPLKFIVRMACSFHGLYLGETDSATVLRRCENFAHGLEHLFIPTLT